MTGIFILGRSAPNQTLFHGDQLFYTEQTQNDLKELKNMLPLPGFYHYVSLKKWYAEYYLVFGKYWEKKQTMAGLLSSSVHYWYRSSTCTLVQEQHVYTGTGAARVYTSTVFFCAHRFSFLEIARETTGCSLNIVGFFSKILKYIPDSGLLRFFLDVYTGPHACTKKIAGWTPALQQNWQS